MAAKVFGAFIVCLIALVVGKDIGPIKEMRTSLTSEVQLGIDLGTTLSVAAVCVQGNVSVIPVEGYSLTPSVVWFDNETDAHEVGAAAVLKRGTHADSVVYASKRLIGLTKADIDKASESLPFVLNTSNGILIELHSGKKQVSPEEVGSLVLQKLKAAAEQSEVLDWFRRSMGFKFHSLTVSVPVTFTDDQRDATMRAGRLAGFDQVRLIDEPVAAALAYGLGRTKEAKEVLVFDLGGGTLDIALMYFSKDAETFFVDATGGEPLLGGEDFDVIVADLLLKDVNDESVSTAFRSCPIMWQKLLVSAEKVKKELSLTDSVEVCLPNINVQDSPCSHSSTVTRNQFEAKSRSKLELAEKAVLDVLEEANVDKLSPLDVVLVGGSSRIPAIRSAIRSILPNARLHYEDVDPDQAVAIGAARSWGCNV